MWGFFIVTVAVPLTVPLVPFIAVIVVLPAASALNAPVVASIVPTAVSLLLQTTVGLIAMGAPNWSKPAAVKVWLPPMASDALAGVTVIEVRTGGDAVAVTVTVTVAVPLTVPLVPFIAVIVVVPAASALNAPVVASIVPTAVSLLLQTTAGLIAMGALNWSKPAAVKV